MINTQLFHHNDCMTNWFWICTHHDLCEYCEYKIRGSWSVEYHELKSVFIVLAFNKKISSHSLLYRNICRCAWHLCGCVTPVWVRDLFGHAIETCSMDWKYKIQGLILSYLKTFVFKNPLFCSVVCHCFHGCHGRGFFRRVWRHFLCNSKLIQKREMFGSTSSSW